MARPGEPAYIVSISGWADGVGRGCYQPGGRDEKMTASLDASTPCADHYHDAAVGHRRFHATGTGPAGPLSAGRERDSAEQAASARIPSPPQAPNTQALVERFIGSIRRECLNHFFFFGAQHLDTVARSWLAHYHAERPHQGRENELLVRTPAAEKSAGIDTTTFSLRDVRCRKRLGGLLKHY